MGIFKKLLNFQKLVIAVGAILIGLFLALLVGRFASFALVLFLILFLGIVLSFFIFRSPEIGWLLIVFFLPFERVPTFNLAGIDIKINTALGFLTIIAWLLAILFNGKKYKIAPNPLAIFLIIFIFSLVLSLTHAVAFDRALMVLFFILFTIMLSVLATNILQNKKILNQTIIVLFCSSLLIGIFGLFQFGGDTIGLPQTLTLLKQGYTKVVFGFPRIQAFSMEPLYFANYLLIPLCVGLAFFFNRTGPLNRWPLIGLLALLLINFILTVSRGGYLGLIGAFLVISILLFKKVYTWRNIIFAILTIAVVGYGVAFALSKGDYRATNEFIGHIMLGDVNRGESIQGRLITFARAMQAYKESPILGVGIGNYGPWNKFYPDATPQKGWDIVNNQYIESLAETGIVGLASLGLLIIAIITRSLIAFRKVRDIYLKSVLIGLLAAFVGVLIQYNFMSTLYIIHIWILIGMLIAVQNIILNSKIEKQNS